MRLKKIGEFEGIEEIDELKMLSGCQVNSR